MVRREDAREVKSVTYYRLCDGFSFGVLILKYQELNKGFRQDANLAGMQRPYLYRKCNWEEGPNNVNYSTEAKNEIQRQKQEKDGVKSFCGEIQTAF